MNSAVRIRLPQEQYIVQHAGDGFVVLDSRTGREMSTLYSGYWEATMFRDKLNTAAFCGRASLHRALGASAALV